MLLRELLEGLSGKAEDKSDVKRHTKKLTDIAKKTFISTAPRPAPALPSQTPAQTGATAPAVPSKSSKPTKAPKSKNFKFTFKEDKGSYQVRMKRDKEGKLKYNYGYYDRDDMPEISINSDALTDEGKDKYEEFKKIIKAMEKGNDRKTETKN